jgi:DNA segregation ATPase FtsK/SpoIIIE, S-DNA-T family
MTRDNALQGVIGDLKGIWLRRGGKVPEAVMDTLEAIYSDKMPIIVKRIKQDSGWLFMLSLRAGDCYANFAKMLPYFQESTGGAVQIEKRGRAVMLRVLTEELRSEYSYQWEYEGYERMALPVPFGYSAAGLLVRDLAQAPNLLIAGHPGAGKSNFLHVLAASLLLCRPVYLCIIDRKRLEYGYLKDKALVVTSNAEALTLLQGINKQLDKRLDTLASAGVVKAQDYEGEMPFIVLVIDELAELDDEDCQEQLNRIARLGRAAGICVVAATQRPSSTMFKKWGDSKAMFAATMCFHVRDEVNSRMVLDNEAAAIIPNMPGRAIYQWETQLEVQAMYLPIKKARQLLSGIEVVRMNVQPPKRLSAR